MYPPPSGPDLTASQRRHLDDTFLSSDPFAYFSSRISMMLLWAEASYEQSVPPITEAENINRETGTRHRFIQFLRRDFRFETNNNSRSITTQVATDAYALRHHAAESLVRLAATLLSREPNETSSVWETLSTGPNQLNLVVEQLVKSSSTENSASRFAKTVLDLRDLPKPLTHELISAIDIFAEWLEFATDLLMGDNLCFNAAHNKIKHGLSVSARDDLRVALTSVPPNPDGTLPVTALKGPETMNIFDRPVIEVIAEAPKIEGHRQGIELTQLRIDVAAVLAETYMIAWVHGAMFHGVASRHFIGRVDLPNHLSPPDHPGYPDGGPRPDQIMERAPLGMRFPLTSPPGGGPTSRSAGIAFRDHFVPLRFSNSSPRKITIVEDERTAD